MPLDSLHELLRDFNGRRDWDQFHNPRNLLLAMAGEVGETAALLQWVPDGQVDEWLAVPANRDSFENEMADVFAYLLQLADRTRTDLEAALIKKVALNEQRYPVDRSRSSSAKYDAL